MPERLGRFEIRARLGAGAFGAVYRAHDLVLDREVALKVPRAAVLEKPEARARFLREPKAAAQLQHPHIVPVFDAGSEGDRYYIASAYIEGRTLEAVIGDQQLDFRRTAAIIHDLAEALQYAHVMGVVHRDVKPANVMLDDRGRAMLMDFGLARLERSEEKLTQDGTVMGTPAYMAPEQADGSFGEVGPASDQYSLGAVLYELLCGQTPFSGPPAVLIFNVLHREPELPRTKNSAIPKDLQTICMKAMSKRPADRYESCGALARDLRRWLECEPIRARRIGLLERTVRWAQRNPAVALLVAAVLIVTVVGLSAVTWQWRRADANWALTQKSLTEVQRQESLAKSNLAEANRLRRVADQRTAQLEESRRQLQEALREARQNLEEAQRQKGTAQKMQNAERVQRAVAETASLAADAARHQAQTNLREAEKLRQLAEQREQHARRQLYAIEMSMAMRAVEEMNWQRVGQLLQSQIPSENRQDLRCFEWYYLAGQFGLGGRPNDASRCDVLRQPGEIYRIAFSTDGRRLMSLGSDSHVRVWDVAVPTLQSKRALPKNFLDAEKRKLPFTSRVPVAEAVVLSPDLDLLALVPQGCVAVGLSTVETGYMIPAGGVRPWLALGGPIAISPDSQMLALVQVVNARALIEPIQNAAVAKVQFEGTAGFNEAKERVAALTTMGVGNALADVGLSGASRAIASYGVGVGRSSTADPSWSMLTLRNIYSEEEQLRLVMEPALIHPEAPHWIRSVHFSPDGKLLAIAHRVRPTGMSRKPVREPYSCVSVWDVDAEEGRFVVNTGPLSLFDQITFSPNGSRLALLHYEEEDCKAGFPVAAPTVVVWETKYGQPVCSFEGSPGANTLIFSPDGETLTMFCAVSYRSSEKERREINVGRTITLWNVADGTQRSVLQGHKFVVRSVAFTPNGKTIATASEDETIRLWDPVTGMERAMFTDHTAGVLSVAFSPDGTILASANAKGSILVYRAAAAGAPTLRMTAPPDPQFVILPRVGLHLEDEPSAGESSGLPAIRVLEIAEDSPAQRAGFQRNDVILQINQQPVSSSHHFSELVDGVESGSEFEVLVSRDGTRRTLLMILNAPP